MPDIYQKIFSFYEAYSTIQFEDLAIPTYSLLWFLTLLIPLTGINKRDLATAATYVAYLISAAVVLLFILPSQYIQLDISLLSEILTLAALAFVASMRWWFRDDLALQKEKFYTAPITDEVSE